MTVSVPDRDAFRSHVQKMYLDSEFSKTWPAGLLDRRPDLLRAEMQLSAATYGVGAAVANLYLDLSLTVEVKGVPGFFAPTWEQWFDPSNPQPPDRR